MAHRWKNDLTAADVTPEAVFWNRRKILAGLAGTGLAAAAGAGNAAEDALEPNSWDDVTNYCNFYEFGIGKSDPAEHAGQLTTSPWAVQIDGLVDRPGEYAFSDIMEQMTIEEADLSFSLCRSLVNGCAVERV